jgi:hypothetical protein
MFIKMTHILAFMFFSSTAHAMAFQFVPERMTPLEAARARADSHSKALDQLKHSQNKLDNQVTMLENSLKELTTFINSIGQVANFT